MSALAELEADNVIAKAVAARAARVLRRSMERSRALRRRRFGMRRSRALDSIPGLLIAVAAAADDFEQPARVELTREAGDMQIYYSPNGAPFPGGLYEQIAAYEKCAAEPSAMMCSPTFYRAGCPIWVSTAYLGVDLSWGSGPPVTWETMVFTGDDMSPVACRRYTSEAAARFGHAQVVAAVRRLQRERRARDGRTAPRRPIRQGREAR